ncbi:MAG TPA: aminoglycoside phosphotransferase family protein [Acidimicrobiales bacterium]|nr:aminoglycoside phosphotransferase family protein [Acidimicrobiales bacterium]
MRTLADHGTGAREAVRGALFAETHRSLVTCDDAGRVVKQHRPNGTGGRPQMLYELRVNRLLARHPPPVPTPRLLAGDRRRGTLVFERAAGTPAGPKYPLELADDVLAAMIRFATVLPSYRPRPRWLRRLGLVSRITEATAAGAITPANAAALRELVAATPLTYAFAHADITPRNVLTDGERCTLIDWEWAGIYPATHDLRFLWFVLVDVREARAVVERHVPAAQLTSFRLCALATSLWHLTYWTNSGSSAAARPRQLDTRDRLLGELIE